jgi:hypothetical protein
MESDNEKHEPCGCFISADQKDDLVHAVQTCSSTKKYLVDIGTVPVEQEIFKPCQVCFEKDMSRGQLVCDVISAGFQQSRAEHLMTKTFQSYWKATQTYGELKSKQNQDAHQLEKAFSMISQTFQEYQDAQVVFGKAVERNDQVTRQVREC